MVFEEKEKPEYPEKNLSKQSREPTNSTHIWRWVRESNPGHIGGRQALSPLRQPCSPISFILFHLSIIFSLFLLSLLDLEIYLHEKKQFWEQCSTDTEHNYTQLAEQADNLLGMREYAAKLEIMRVKEVCIMMLLLLRTGIVHVK